ncbi:MAG TPA: formyltransferase family protein [Solirubrobacteraceae bacterium]|nr:formyltransferase family protein [Solirubrobacteraceae bacterium]
MRIVLLVPAVLDSFFTRALASVLDDPQLDVVGALVERRPRGSRLRVLRRELRKGRGGFVLVMAARRLRRTRSGGGEPAIAFLERHGVRGWPVSDLYAFETIALLRSLDADCAVRSGFGIIREPVLSIPQRGMLSYHHGDIRRYRGQPVAFWELYNGEREMAVTVQLLSERLDAGRIVVQRPVPIRPTDSWRDLRQRAYDAGVDMLHEACRLVARDDFVPEVVPPEQLGDLYTLPNLRQWLGLQRRVLLRRLRAARS